MSDQGCTPAPSSDEIADLRARLEEAEETLRAIRSGEVDAIVIHGAEGPRLFSLKSAEAESNRLRGDILGQVSDAVIAVDLEQRITFFNKSAERQYGVSANEALGRKLTEIFTVRWPAPDDEAAARTALRERGEWRGENVHLARGGTELQVESTVTMLRDSDGGESGAISVLRDITARKQSEAALRANRDTFFTLIENAPFGVYVVDAEFRLRQVSAGSQKAFQNVRPLLGRDFAEVMRVLWPESFASEAIARFRHTLATGEPYVAPLLTEQRADTDAVESYDWKIERVALPDGQWGVVCYFYDITDRKQVEDALRESESRKSAILDGALDGIITMDHEGKVVDFNPAAEAMFGLRRADIVGRAMAEKIIPERLRSRHYDGLAHYLASGEGPVLKKRIEVPALHADGHEFAIELSINRIAGMEPPMFTATLRDITERQQAEAALRESEERFRNLSDNIPQLAWIADVHTDGQVHWFNKGWFDYTGTTLEEMRGSGWQKVHHPDHAARVVEKFERHVREGLDWEDIFPLRRADGEFRWFLSRMKVIRNEAGQVARLFGTNTDVTEQREAADALARAKEEIEAASRAKDDFLAALSHELRTPLTPVLMTASSLETDTALPIEVRDQLGMMRRNIELEARLIDDLLDITRISRGKLTIAPVVADLHQLLNHTAEIVRSDGLGKQVRIVFMLNAEQHHTLADPTRLQQVFWNLIKNALKFTPTGGSITVSTRNDDEGWIIVTVEDTGVGISAEALPDIFKAFEQGDVAGQHRYGGLGLGLAISQAIVEVHGGTIRADSKGAGYGATFTVIVASVDAPAPSAHAPVPQTAPARSLRLLVVEDHEATRTVLSRLLTRDGHHVTTAETMREALSTFAAARFDAVISDLGLPDGSGLDLMREIQRQRPVPGIALSGYGMEDDLRQTKEAGFFAHLVKPVNIEQLRRLLDQLAAP